MSLPLPENTKKALGQAADYVRAAETSLRQLEERLRAEAADDEDLQGYLASIEGARRLVEDLSGQLRSYIVDR